MATDFDDEALFFAGVVSKAEILSLLSILDEICTQIGYRDPENLSVVDRFYKQRLVELEKLFRSLEDGNPALAARLHERYEAARKALGEGRS
jgi:hypothetical protein